jgi:hypothetical protein
MYLYKMLTHNKNIKTLKKDMNHILVILELLIIFILLDYNRIGYKLLQVSYFK